ncbi:MAG TPA: glycogen debranching protein GlgX [Nocardioides sp.]|nr:glycogen debranching protein GlgX [Nocardioides sp.]HEX3930818.1 glycogen debranching protein GlgX [Nocardioides sp.]
MTPGTWRRPGESAPVWPGRTWPLGASYSPEATNFAVRAPEATRLWVCLFDDEGHETRHALTEVSLGIWHGEIPDVAVGDRYGFRADGPWAPELGLRFNPDKLLLDPYARAVSGELREDPAIYGYDVSTPQRRSTLDSAPYVPRGVVVHDPGFDWGDDRRPYTRWRDTVIYELHVKGMTALHDRVPASLRGTYAGLATPPVLDYLRDLGVTAVELLPVQQFVSEPRLLRRGMSNYWGYNTLGFFAPHAAYSAAGDRGGQVREFKEMVRAFHAAGLEVILDVVYNHTAEGEAGGPTLSFRGLDDRGFYHRVDDRLPGDPYVDTYWDITGCGNTVNSSDPFALRLVLDSLRYWASQMRVDGFRFDLASALARGGQEVDMAAPLMLAIGQDPTLRHVKLVAEPWDASAEGYRVGEFPSGWVEWNDQYRDTVRDFWRGRSSGIRTVATRLAGSSDLYADDGRSPYASVNFVTAHDGFTLRDLVSYDVKHNAANGDGGRDGSDDNRSQSFGTEGESDDPEVTALRRRTAANLLVTLCLSNGVPMLTAGDERGRTQRGNNNPYVQDNDVSWVDWRSDDAWLDVYEITKAALRLRREHPALRQRHWFEGRPTIVDGRKDLAWVHPEGREMTGDDWADNELAVVGMLVTGDPLRSPGPRGEQQWDSSFLIWLNAEADAVKVTMPSDTWVREGEVVVSTCPDHPVGTTVSPGESMTLDGRTVVVVREV